MAPGSRHPAGQAAGSPAEDRPRGERDLAVLLARLAPVLDPVAYAFCRSPGESPPQGLAAFASVREEEGLTLILGAEAAAAAGLAIEFLARRIVLTVHSDLAAVGMLARVATALAAAGVPCNVVAGLHHDHLFVPEADAGRALAALEALTRAHAAGPEVIYAVTVEVDGAIAPAWLAWMQAVHVPRVMATGCFLGVEVGRRLDPSPDGGDVAFVVEYRAASAARLEEYQARHAPALQQDHTARYAGRARASRTVRERLAGPPFPGSAPGA